MTSINTVSDLPPRVQYVASAALIRAVPDIAY